MDYQEFKTYLETFLWKVGDSVLIANLDNIITMAEHELRRKLPINVRETSTVLVAEGVVVPLPVDFSQMIYLGDGDNSYSNVTAYALQSERIRNTGSTVPIYHVQNGALMLANNASVSDPLSLNLVYRAKLPDFAIADSSWLADDFLDLYTYAVLKHSAPFLREDERIPVWQGLYSDALDSVIEDNLWGQEYGGSPTAPLMARPAP